MDVRTEELRTVNVIVGVTFRHDSHAHCPWLKFGVVRDSYIRYRGFNQFTRAHLGYPKRTIWVDPHIAGRNTVVSGRRVLNEEGLATIV